MKWRIERSAVPVSGAARVQDDSFHPASSAARRPTLSPEGTRKIYAGESRKKEEKGEKEKDNITDKGCREHRWASVYRDDLLRLDDVRARTVVSLQEAQAMLLLRLDEARAARAIEKCGSMRWPCGQRLCPACSSRWHRVHRRRLEEAFDQMSRPTALLLKVFSNTISVTSLKTALRVLSRGWRALKRRAVMNAITMFAGVLEVAPVRLGGRWVWCVHVHGIAELHGNFDQVAAERAWRKITGKRNSTLGAESIRTRAGYLTYISKMRDRCPTPGALPHGWFLKVLSRAMKNEHAWFEWGSLTRRGRQRRRRGQSRATSDGIGERERRTACRSRPAPIRWVIRLRGAANRARAP